VLVGLAVNRDGFPLAHEVMAGNRHDSTTLDQMLAALDQRVGLREGQTVVVDRGMSGQENLDKIRARGLHYLVAAPYSERQEWVEEFQDAAEFEEVRREPSPRNPAQKKSTIQVKLRQAGGETHVLWMKQRGWVSSHPPEDPTVA
jgi:transposase